MSSGGMLGKIPLGVSGKWNVMDRFRGDVKPNRIVATGGTVTNITQNGNFYKVHSFTSNGTFTVTDLGYPRNQIEYLVVGGGAGGSGGQPNIVGAGGDGGKINEGASVVSQTAYSVTRGNGGGGGGYTGGGANGGSSSIAGISTADGGYGNPPNIHVHGLGADGSGATSSLAYRKGKNSSITGTVIGRGGGGATSFMEGGSMDTYFGGASHGGVGGVSASANTGGGGSGAYNQNAGGSGGSGIVIIRYFREES